MDLEKFLSDFFPDNLNLFLACPFNWLREISTEEHRNARSSNLEATNLATTLIGFSKGCTVINQCLMSMCEKCIARKDGCCFNVKKIVLLDSGHNGPHTFYPVTVIPQLKKMRAKVEIWISPFQMRKERNGDVKQTEIDQLCKEMPDLVSVKKCRWQDKPSLDCHFLVLQEYLESLKSV